MDKKRWKKKGYMTVEAAFILSMSVLAAGLMLSLCFHVYQRCWYTQAACETVLAGSSQGVLKGDLPVKRAEKKWEMLKNEFYLHSQDLSAAVSGSDSEVRCRITGSTPVWGSDALKLSADVSWKMVRPVKFIRKTAALLEQRK